MFYIKSISKANFTWDIWNNKLHWHAIININENSNTVFFKNKYAIKHVFYTKLSGHFAPIFYFNCEYVLFVNVVKQKQNKTNSLWIFQKKSWILKFFKNQILLEANFYKFDHPLTFPNFGPDRFIRFDVYWTHTNRQTPKQTNRQAKFIYRYIYLHLVLSLGPMKRSMNKLTEIVAADIARVIKLVVGTLRPEKYLKWEDFILRYSFIYKTVI